jgi:hypothetical protein
MNDKTINEQANIPLESPLWEELSHEASESYVGGNLGGVSDFFGLYFLGILTNVFVNTNETDPSNPNSDNTNWLSSVLNILF